MDADAKTVGAHLDNPESSARALLSRARRLDELQRTFRQLLLDEALEPLAQSLGIANERDGLLIIHASSAAAYTELRYRKEEILELLKDRLADPSLKLEIAMKLVS